MLKLLISILTLLLSYTSIIAQVDTVYYGDLKGVGTTINTHKNGHWQFWYSNGQLQSEGKYINDTVTGVWKNYHENGNLMLKAEYKMGMPFGDWLAYFVDGEEFSPHYYSLLGLDHHDNGDYQLAIGYLNKAIKLDSSKFQFYGIRGNCYAKLHKYEEAARDFSVVCQYDKRSESYNRLAELLYLGSSFSEALSTINKSKEVNSEVGSTYFIAGLIYLKLNRPKEACENFLSAQKYGEDRLSSTFKDEFSQACR